jgi:hypothetical protein
VVEWAFMVARRSPSWMQTICVSVGAP